MTSVGIRIVLTEDEGRRLFNEQLPLCGTIEREITSFDGNRWSLVALDRPFDYQVQDAQTKAFHGFEVKKLLIRSRWAGYSVGGTEPTSVFVLIADEDSLFHQENIDPKRFYFDAWAMCTNEQSGQQGARANHLRCHVSCYDTIFRSEAGRIQIVMRHEPRQRRSWLIFDVRQNAAF